MFNWVGENGQVDRQMSRTTMTTMATWPGSASGAIAECNLSISRTPESASATYLSSPGVPNGRDVGVLVIGSNFLRSSELHFNIIPREWCKWKRGKKTDRKSGG